MSERTCVVDDCDSPSVARGWCRKHYMRWSRHGDPLRERPRRMCEVPGCANGNFGQGLCEMHYTRRRNYGSVAARPDPRRRDRSAGEGLRCCLGCSQVLAVDQFHRDRSRWDGLATTCKSCEATARAEHETTEFIEVRNTRRKARRDADIESERAKRRAAYATNPSGARAWSQARRAAKKRANCETFTDLEIFKRDGWTCGICGEAIDPALRWPHPRSASLDHVIPLSRGGAHSRENTQAACLTCNLSKGARIVARDSEAAS